MKSFGSLLDETVKENGWSKNQFIKSFGLNSGNYYKIVKGQNRMTEKMLMKMISSNNFTKSQESQLIELYWQEEYHQDALERILYIKDRYNAISHDSDPLIKLKKFTPSEVNESIIGSTNIVRAIVFILNNELNNDMPTIFTNYPYTNTNIDNHIFEILKKSDKHINYKHIIRFIDNKKSTENLCSIFSSIRYAEINFNTYYCPLSTNLSDEIDMIYSCFFISSSYVFLFNPINNIGILSSDQSLIQTSISSAELAFHKAKPLVTFYENVFKFKNDLEKHQIHLKYSFDSIPCIANTVDASVVEKMIRPEIPNRSLIVESIIHHFSLLCDSSNKHCDTFYSLKGVEFFANTGESYVAGHDIAPVFPPDIRIIILENLLKLTPKSNIHYLNEQKLSIPDSFILEGSDTAIQIAIKTNNDNSFYGQCLITITDNNIISDFNNFKNYISKACYCLPDDYINYFLNDLIISLKNKVNN